MKIFSSSTIVIGLLLIIFSFYFRKKYELLVRHFLAIVFSGFIVFVVELFNRIFNQKISAFLVGLLGKIVNKIDNKSVYALILIFIFLVSYIVSYIIIKYLIKRKDPFFEIHDKKNIVYGVVCGSIDVIVMACLAITFVFLIEPQSYLETGFLEFLKPFVQKVVTLL